jgi:hypothetical protein
MIFESLDFLYVPAPNIEESIMYYTKVLDGELLWKIHAYGVWVACVRLSNKEPHILLANHIGRLPQLALDLIILGRIPIQSHQHN